MIALEPTAVEVLAAIGAGQVETSGPIGLDGWQLRTLDVSEPSAALLPAEAMERCPDGRWPRSAAVIVLVHPGLEREGREEQARAERDLGVTVLAEVRAALAGGAEMVLIRRRQACLDAVRAELADAEQVEQDAKSKAARLLAEGEDPSCDEVKALGLHARADVLRRRLAPLERLVADARRAAEDALRQQLHSVRARLARDCAAQARSIEADLVEAMAPYVLKAHALREAAAGLAGYAPRLAWDARTTIDELVKQLPE